MSTYQVTKKWNEKWQKHIENQCFSFLFDDLEDLQAIMKNYDIFFVSRSFNSLSIEFSKNNDLSFASITKSNSSKLYRMNFPSENFDKRYIEENDHLYKVLTSFPWLEFILELEEAKKARKRLV